MLSWIKVIALLLVVVGHADIVGFENWGTLSS